MSPRPADRRSAGLASRSLAAGSRSGPFQGNSRGALRTANGRGVPIIPANLIVGPPNISEVGLGATHIV